LYGQYSQYKRFKLENYEYKVAKNIDLGYHDKSFVLDYYEAIEDINSHVKAQWSANSIDVRVPEDDNEETKVAVKAYTRKLAKVKYYEGQLLLSARLKKEGVNNADVKSYQDDGITKGEKLNQDRKERLFALFGNVSNTVKLGDNGPLVFEIQKLLKSKGQDVIVDGVFKEMTAKAILTFEQEQKLYPDGKLDVFTFEKLLE